MKTEKFDRITKCATDGALGFWVRKTAAIPKRNFWGFSVCFFALCLLSGCAAKEEKHLPYYETPDFTPHFLKPSEAEKTIKHTIAPFRFTDENGTSSSNENVAGKIYVADFIFTTCGSICPVMTDRMKAVADSFARDTSVSILSFSVMPWVDSPAQLRVYRERKAITNPRWHFLTGDKNEIYKLARQSFFAEEELGYNRDSAEFLHTEHFLLIDKTGRIRGIYNGTLAPEVGQLISDIRLLKKEA